MLYAQRPLIFVTNWMYHWVHSGKNTSYSFGGRFIYLSKKRALCRTWENQVEARGCFQSFQYYQGPDFELKAVFSSLFSIAFVRLDFGLWCLLCLHFPGSLPIPALFTGKGFPWTDANHCRGNTKVTGATFINPISSECRNTAKADYDRHSNFQSIYRIVSECIRKCSVATQTAHL